jgi:Ca2+-binding RTX toxin-like protein
MFLIVGIAGGTIFLSNAIHLWAASINCQFKVPCLGTSKDDTLEGTADKNSIWGLDGKDVVEGLAGDDSSYGGNDSDILYGGNGNDNLVGGAGTDRICGNSGDDYLVGKEGNDIIFGDKAPTNVMSKCTATKSGTDKLWGDSGNDIIYGGANGQTKDIESIYGGAGNDKLYGDDGDDDVFGQDGIDLIVGGPGNDYLFAGESDLTTNTTVIPGEPGDKLWGGPGRDVFDCGGLSSSSIQDFESGVDMMQNCYQGNVSNIITGNTNLNLPAKYCQSTSNPCYGTDESEFLIGDEGDNQMYAKMGNDVVEGSDGSDEMYGDENNDYMYGGSGNDYLTGGLGQNYLDGQEGDDSLYGDLGFGDTIHGGDGNDILYGGSSTDLMDGGIGADEINGNAGNDIIAAGSPYGYDIKTASEPDGFKDRINCGLGTDEAWLNKDIDGDEAIECEKVNGQPVSGVGQPPNINTDSDNDFVSDSIDNCRDVSNNSQQDQDGDGKGDACDPYPFDSSKTSHAKVTFKSIIVRNDHDGLFRGSGEWDLAAYVQGHRIMLTEASPDVVCGSGNPGCDHELFWVDDNEKINFKPGTEIDLDIPSKWPLSIFTVGSEVDDCGRDTFPEVIPDVVTSTAPFDYTKVSWIQYNIDHTIGSCLLPATSGKSNDLLGTINVAQNLTPGEQTYYETSKSNDFSLVYTIDVTS